MPQKNSIDFIRLEKIAIAGVVVAAVAFVLFQFKDGKPSFSPNLVKDLKLEEPKNDYADFSQWRVQSNFGQLFNFYIPGSLEISTIEEGKRFHIIAPNSEPQLITSIEQLEYADFQKEKQTIDKQGQEQFGWTNAYGASVFEYRKDLLTSFVVDKEKKKVIKFVTTDQKNFSVVDNIIKTFQSTAKETDIHGPWYVNFKGKYKIRYASDLVLGVNAPFTNYVDWDSAKLGKIQLSTYDANEKLKEFEFYDLLLNTEKNTEIASGTNDQVKVLQDLKADGVPAKLYAGGVESGTVGIVWKKDNTYFVLNGSWNSPQTLQMGRNTLSNMLVSFRFLTDQESIK